MTQDVIAEARERYEDAAAAMHANLRRVAAGSASEPASAVGEPLVKITLVPVEVFGADEEDCPNCPTSIRTGYGLSDAVSAWSDCNRAIGHIYRVDDIEGRNAEGAAGCITVYVPESEMAKFSRPYGGDDGYRGDRCPACKVPYAELPKEHRLSRPTCTGQVPA